MAEKKTKVLRGTRRVYTSEVKAACMALLLAGQRVGEVSKQYNIPPATLSNWKRLAFVAPSKEIAKGSLAERGKKIGDMLLDVLETNLEALQFIGKQFRDKEWLNRQDAADLAIAQGVITDKTIALLEAMAKAQMQTHEDERKKIIEGQ